MILEIYKLTWNVELPLDWKPIGPFNVKVAEVFFTLKACNITTGDGDKPYFNFLSK
jgi:hypothetical protein